jgi:post-segregation antitoxin (ccd killing protein)
MPKVSVYLPDDLYQRARESGLKLSAVTQAAVRAELDRHPNARWVEAVRHRQPRVEREIDSSRLLADVRDEFDT